MKIIRTSTLAELSREAAGAPRRRRNLNLHPELSDPIQRLLNAIEPGSYVPPHRHSQPPKWEVFAILSGRLAVLLFDDEGTVVAREELDARGEARLLEIPAAAWHTVVALEPGTVVFEVKPGPYSAMADKDFAPWAPQEGAGEAAAMVERFGRAAVGDRLAP